MHSACTVRNSPAKHVVKCMWYKSTNGMVTHSGALGQEVHEVGGDGLGVAAHAVGDGGQEHAHAGAGVAGGNRLGHAGLGGAHPLLEGALDLWGGGLKGGGGEPGSRGMQRASRHC